MPVLLSRRVDQTHRDGSQFAITITNMPVAECQSSWSRYPRDCTRLVARAVTPMHPRLPPTLGPHCTVSLRPMMRAALQKALRRTIVVSRRRLACIAHRGSDMPNARRFGQSCVPKRGNRKSVERRCFDTKLPNASRHLAPFTQLNLVWRLPPSHRDAVTCPTMTTGALLAKCNDSCQSGRLKPSR